MTDNLRRYLLSLVGADIKETYYCTREIDSADEFKIIVARWTEAINLLNGDLNQYLDAAELWRGKLPKRLNPQDGTITGRFKD